MTGCTSDFKAFVKNIAPHVTYTHCMIHRYALAMTTLPPGLLEGLTDVLNIVNNIRGSSTSRIFKAFFEEMGANFCVLLFHTEVHTVTLKWKGFKPHATAS